MYARNHRRQGARIEICIHLNPSHADPGPDSDTGRPQGQKAAERPVPLSAPFVPKEIPLSGALESKEFLYVSEGIRTLLSDFRNFRQSWFS